MKFNDYEIIRDDHGFEFVKNGIMKGSKKLRCATCGELTEFIEVCSEEECVQTNV